MNASSKRRVGILGQRNTLTMRLSMRERNKMCRFSLRTMLVVVGIVAIVLCIWRMPIFLRYRYLVNMERAGARFEISDRSRGKSITARLKYLVFGQAAGDVDIAVFGGPFVNEEAKLTQRVQVRRDDIDYANLVLFDELRELDLSSSDTNDDDLLYIGKLTRLQILRLDGTAISDRGLKALSELTNLKLLSISRTNTTAAGTNVLSSRLPQCEVLTQSIYMQHNDDNSSEEIVSPDRTLLAPVAD